jgi:uncharacterized cupin superfamily protein
LVGDVVATEKRMTYKLSVEQISAVRGAAYPAPFDAPCRARERRPLGDAAGLSQFGVNLMRLAPGTWSSQRHWHTAEDEFIYILSGEVVLVTNQGEEILRAGDCAGFKANVADGHHLQNRSTQEATLLEIGSRNPADGVHYSDIDLGIAPGSDCYTHRDGRPYR